MARKGIFGKAIRNAMTADPDTMPVDDIISDDELRRVAPNVGYFSQSVREQMARSLQDIDPEKIKMSRFADRLDISDNLDELKRSIAESGQQVPVLLRKVGEDYEVVYGRRRVMASRQLGIQVRAMVVEMAEEEALIAQGLENAARLENSYIERALFVAQIIEAGYTNVTVEKAIGVEETQASRMRGIVRDIPRGLINAIGPAHGAGRRQWEDLRKYVNTLPDLSDEDFIGFVRSDMASADRLKALLAELKVKAAPPSPGSKPSETSAPRIVRGKRKISISDVPEEFISHLEAEMPAIFERWLSEHK